MVLGVCRQLLGDHQHAEDAFQAVFLVLARRARSLREPELLGNWLYGVALRTARTARTRLARRRTVRGSRRHQASHGVPGRAGRSGADRSRAGRGAASRDRSPAGRLPHAGGALLLRGPHPRRGGRAAAMARRHAPQPTGPRAGEAPPRTHPPRVRAARRRAGRRARFAACRGVRLIAPVRLHGPGRDPLRGPSCRRRGALGLDDGPCPGGAEIHADPSNETRRTDHPVPRAPLPLARGTSPVRSRATTDPVSPRPPSCSHKRSPKPPRRAG